jgi:hypothetical protein
VTLADRIAEVLEVQPLPVCDLATTLRKRKAEVIATLNENPDRFVLTGKARASRWNVREVDVSSEAQVTDEEAVNGVDVGTAVDDLATRWERDLELDPYTAASFVSWFVQIGYLERVDGNGRVRVTELGRQRSHVWNGAGA